MRKKITIDIEDTSHYKKQLLEWAREKEDFILLDSNDFTEKYPEKQTYTFDFIAAFGQIDSITSAEHSGFAQISDFLEKKQDWIFGFFGYDLKNELEDLSSENIDEIDFPGLYFFQPEFVVLSFQKQAEIQFLPEFASESQVYELLNQISNQRIIEDLTAEGLPVSIESRFSREEYLETIQKLRSHIKRGDVYEINFCQEFYAWAEIDPYSIYRKLSGLSPSPFASFFKLNDKFLLSSSPERFLRKNGSRVISQPIKGTSRRGRNKKEDKMLKDRLYYDKKERAENVMIVDLVRNDLSRTAKPESVHVDELYGIYSFEQVHQMISTISCEIEQKDYLECLKNCFPMGSMTGAPKVRAMQLIEQYEKTKRGLYSGAVGYFSPERDYDFNVVIRSILYNSSKKYVSYSVGGAITYLSDPEKEYEECMVKANAMSRVLKS